VPEVVSEEVPVEGAMIAVRTAAPSPPRGASAASSLAPHAAAAVGTAANTTVRPEVILGHPTFYAAGNIPLDEAVSMAPRALS
jgi:hypothetical protein